MLQYPAVSTAICSILTQHVAYKKVMIWPPPVHLVKVRWNQQHQQPRKNVVPCFISTFPCTTSHSIARKKLLCSAIPFRYVAGEQSPAGCGDHRFCWKMDPWKKVSSRFDFSNVRRCSTNIALYKFHACCFKIEYKNDAASTSEISPLN